MARRGLIVNYYFPPAGGGGVQRWVKMLKYLQRYDWQFTVITAEPAAAARDDSLLSEIPASTRIIRIPNAEPLGRGVEPAYWKRWLSALIHITDSRGGWNAHVRAAVQDELARQPYEVLIISSPPYSLARLAAQLSVQVNLPVVLDMRDPWTRNPYKLHPTPLHRYWDRRIEKKTISTLRYLTAAYQSTIDYYSEFTGLIAATISNGYDEDDFNGVETTFLPPVGERFKLAFSGTFYSHLNRPDNVFYAIAELKKQGVPVEFHHVGKSAYSLQALAAKYGIEELVTIHGYRSHPETLQLLAKMDGLCLILDDRNVHAGATVGGKMYEYLRLRKPILALVPADGDAARIVNETSAGMVCPNSNRGEIVHNLRHLVSGKYEFRPGDIGQYSRTAQAERMNEFLLRVISERPER